MVLNSIIADRSRGSIGNVTISKWKNLTVGRQKPTQVSNPNTTGQQFQRSKMSFIALMYGLLKGVVTVGYKSQTGYQTEYNGFTQHNIKNLFTNEPGQPLAFDWNEFQIAKGPMKSTAVTATLASGTVNLEWNATPDELNGQSSNDVPCVAIINAQGDVLATDVYEGTTRSEGEFGIGNTGLSSLTGIKVFVFFASPDLSKCSTSVIATNA